MNYDKYFENVTLERINEELDRVMSLKADPEAFIKALQEVPDDLRAAFVIRGMMYVCLEVEFGMQGDEIWSACDLYQQVSGAASELWNEKEEDAHIPEGFKYYN